MLLAVLVCRVCVCVDLILCSLTHFPLIIRIEWCHTHSLTHSLTLSLLVPTRTTSGTRFISHSLVALSCVDLYDITCHSLTAHHFTSPSLQAQSLLSRRHSHTLHRLRLSPLTMTSFLFPLLAYRPSRYLGTCSLPFRSLNDARSLSFSLNVLSASSEWFPHSTSDTHTRSPRQPWLGHTIPLSHTERLARQCMLYRRAASKML